MKSYHRQALKNFKWNFIYRESVTKMKENDWQRLRYFLFWLALPFLLLVFRSWEKLFINTDYKFFAFFGLHRYRQMASIFTFLWEYSVKFLLLTCLRSIKTRKVTCDNSGAQTTQPNIARHKKRCSVGTLYCTHCPYFSANSQLISITILLRSTAPQNLMLLSSVNFVFKTFQDFTLYVNIGTPNMALLSGQQMLIQTI